MSEVIEQEAVEVGAELMAYEQQTAVTLFHTDDPALVVQRAADTADALMKVVNARKETLVSNISGKDFPKVECWSLLGTMLGVFPVTAWTRPIFEDGKVVGYEARVEAHTRDGAVVGAAESMCTRSERTWKTRDDFALRGMAETRATSRALRKPLGFVMTLAGLEATSAEEMPEPQAQPKAENQRRENAWRAPGNFPEWEKRMHDIGVPEAALWAQEALAVGAVKEGENRVERLNEVLEALEKLPEGFSDSEIPTAFAAITGGVLIHGPDDIPFAPSIDGFS